MSCSLVGVYHQFRGTYHLHIHGRTESSKDAGWLHRRGQPVEMEKVAGVLKRTVPRKP
jgi:hypothetical protein